MFSFLFTYTLKSEKDRDDFLAELLNADIPGLVAAEDGCNIYKYCLPVDEPEKIYIVESWIDEQAQKVHCTQPHCNIIRSLKEKYSVQSDMISL